MITEGSLFLESPAISLSGHMPHIISSTELVDAEKIVARGSFHRELNILSFPFSSLKLEKAKYFKKENGVEGYSQFFKLRNIEKFENFK